MITSVTFHWPKQVMGLLWRPTGVETHTCPIRRSITSHMAGSNICGPGMYTPFTERSMTYFRCYKIYHKTWFLFSVNPSNARWKKLFSRLKILHSFHFSLWHIVLSFFLFSEYIALAFAELLSLVTTGLGLFCSLPDPPRPHMVPSTWEALDKYLLNS